MESKHRGFFGDPYINGTFKTQHELRPRIIVELSQEELARLDRASGGMGAAGLVRAVALRLADQAAEIQAERLRAAFDEAIAPVGANTPIKG